MCVFRIERYLLIGKVKYIQQNFRGVGQTQHLVQLDFSCTQHTINRTPIVQYTFLQIVKLTVRVKWRIASHFESLTTFQHDHHVNSEQSRLMLTSISLGQTLKSEFVLVAIPHNVILSVQ